MRKSPNIAFLLSFLLPGAGLWYLGKWRWGFINLAVVLLIGMAAALLMPDQMFDNYIGYMAAGCSGGSAGLAQVLAKQLNVKSQPDDKS